MSQQSTGPSRLSRIAAKEVPHRKTGRFFAAKSDVKTSCEQLVHDVKRSALHDAMKSDMLHAADLVNKALHDMTEDTPGGRNELVELEKQVEHLQLAEKWVNAAERVLTRLGPDASKDVRDRVLETQDKVMWCVRAEQWDGQLTAALSALTKEVQEAEVLAARADA
ncbi:MAG: hypothetical protein PHU75_05530 [Candidatus Nanopelagicales bacterium]|nr:hypothetical protein [Candidatus Nanopelagicales bacterium]